MVRKVLVFRPTLADGGADRVTVTLLQQLDRSKFHPALVLLRKEGAFLEDLPDDVQVEALNTRRLATCVPALARVLRRQRPDVLFSTSSAANPLAVAAHRLARSPARLVLSERNALFRGRKRDPKQQIEVLLKRVTYRMADLVTAVSQGVADQVVHAIGVRPDRVHVVYNPMVDPRVDALSAEPVDLPWFGGPEPVVLAVGRLVPQKDYPTLLAGFKTLLKHVAARLVVLGEGPLRQQLMDHTRQLGLADRVHFAGFHKNPFKFMAKASILMHASRAEGLPGSLIQSMACGTPVISTDCDYGPREVIQQPGVDGFLVPVGDAEALADRAHHLLTCADERRRMGEAARLSVQRFTVPESIRRYENAMEG